MKIKTLLALIAAVTSTLSHADDTWDVIKNDLAQISRIADADFWRGIYEVGTSVDFNIDPTGLKVSDGTLALVGGVGLTSYGVIKELAVRKYPELSIADATELYSANLKRRMSRFLTKRAPRLYRAPVGVSLAEDVRLGHPPTRRFGGLADHPWSNRAFFIGGGAALTLTAVAYLLMIVRFHPDFDTDGKVQDEIQQILREQQAGQPLDVASLSENDYANPQTLIRLLGENRSANSIEQLAIAHPQLAEQIHELALAVVSPD